MAYKIKKAKKRKARKRPKFSELDEPSKELEYDINYAKKELKPPEVYELG